MAAKLQCKRTGFAWYAWLTYEAENIQSCLKASQSVTQNDILNKRNIIDR